MFERAQSTWTLAVLSLLALPAAAQKTEAEVKADLDFARGLATDWSFMDLAEGVLESIEEEGVSTEMEALLAETKCSMYAAAAINERDSQRRIELFTEALDAYGTLIDRSYNSVGNEDFGIQAAYVDTASKAIIAYDRGLEEATGERASELIDDKTAMLEGAITRINEIVDQIKAQLDVQPSTALRRNLWNVWLNGAKLSTEFAVMNGNSEWDIKRSETYLEELNFDAQVNGSVPYEMLSYIGLGEHYMRVGQPSLSVDFFAAVIEQLIPSDRGLWEESVKELELSDADIYQRFIFLERAVGGLVDAAIESGNAEMGTQYALHFYNVWKRYGFDLTPGGYQSLITAAKGLLEFGGYVGGNQNAGETAWYATVEDMEAKHRSSRDQDDAISFALRLSRTVGEDNRGNILQLRAQQLVSDIIARPGVEVSPDLLYEAARGEYFDDDFGGALASYRRLLSDLDAEDQATRIAYGAKVMNGIGNCFRKMERPLESAMAFREGCTTWVGDPEFDEQNANGYYRMIQQVQRTAGSEGEPLADLLAEAENLVATIGTQNKDEVLFNLGQKKEREKDWDAAIAQYQQIERGSEYWERAQAQIGVAHFNARDFTKALQQFDYYLEDFLEDPVNAEAGDEIRVARRAEAAATATVFRGYIYALQAKQSGKEADHQRVITALNTFQVDFPTQDRSAPVAMKFVLDSHLALGDVDAARAVLDKMLADFEDAGPTGRAATAFALALEARLQASEDAEERIALQTELAQRLEVGNTKNPSAPFGNLRKESEYWLATGNWKESERVLQRIVDDYGSTPENKSKVDTFVRPDLATALMQQRRLGEAKAVLDPVIQDENVRATKTITRLWARSITGWLEGKGSSISVVPGAGGTEEEYTKIAEGLNLVEAGFDKWIDCDWYAVKFEIAYAYYRASEEHDSRNKDLMKRVLSPIEAEVGSRYDQVGDFCAEGEEDDPATLARYGDDVLRDHYRWLSSKL